MTPGFLNGGGTRGSLGPACETRLERSRTMNDSGDVLRLRLTFLIATVGIAAVLVAFFAAVIAFHDAKNPGQVIPAVLGAVTAAVGTLAGLVAGRAAGAAGRERAEDRAEASAKEAAAGGARSPRRSRRRSRWASPKRGPRPPAAGLRPIRRRQAPRRARPRHVPVAGHVHPPGRPARRSRRAVPPTGASQVASTDGRRPSRPRR